MSELSATSIPKPSDEQAFERCNEVLWRYILNDPGVHLHGRRGQSQQGVDIVGCRDGEPDRIVGIQCKLIGENKPLREEQVRVELEKALKFRPILSEFIIVTTAPDDSNLQSLALKLSKSSSANREKPLKVSIFGWSSLEREIRRYPEALNAFDPSHTPQNDLLARKIDDMPDKVTAALKPELQAILAEVTRFTRPVDSANRGTEAQSEHERQIEVYADLISTDPETALDLLQKLKANLDNNASECIQFRVLANIAKCQLQLGNEEFAAKGFIAAWNLDPDNPEAVANKALGLLLKQDWPGLKAFVEPRLREQQDNAVLAACYIHSLIVDETITDPLALVPEAARETPQVAEAHIRWVLNRGSHGAWWDVAIGAHDAHPDNEALAEMCASALLDRVLTVGRSDYRQKLTSTDIADIQTAVQIYNTRWPHVRDRVRYDRGDLTSIALNLMVAYRLLGQTDKGIEVGNEALVRFPNNATVKEYLASALVELGEFDQALDLVSGLGITPKTVTVHYNTAMAREDWCTVLELVSNHIGSFSEAERGPAQAAGIVAKLELAAPDDRRSILKDHLRDFVNDTRALARLAQSARRHGFNDLSREYFAAALAALENGDDSLVARFSVADEASARQEPNTAAKLLFGYVPLDRDSYELQLLAQALVNDYPIRERAIRFFNDLSPEIRSLPAFQRLEGALHINRGSPQDAIPPLSAAFGQQPTVDSLMYLVRSYFSVGDRTAIAALLQRDDVDALTGSPTSRINFSHLLLNFGEAERALSVGYQALVDGLEDSVVVVKYLGLILSYTQNYAEYESQSALTSGDWVRLTQTHGDSYEVLIGEAVDRPWGAKADSSNTFIVKALGRRPGDSFKHVNVATGATETWTVAEVKPRWLQAFQHLGPIFSQKFPDASGFASINMAEGDIQPALDLVRRHSEEQREQANLYLVNRLPMAFVAAGRPGGAIAFAQYLASLGEDVRVCLGTEDERTEALHLINSNARNGAVLDAFTAWHAATLGIFPVLRERLGSVTIPVSELDRLKLLIDHHQNLVDSETMHLDYQDGHYVREVVTPEEHAQSMTVAESTVDDIERACSVEPLVIPDNMSELGEQLLRLPPADAVAPAIIAGRNRLLLTEDMMMRQLTGNAYGTKGVWLQAVLLSAMQAETIEIDDYIDALVYLSAKRHGYITINSSVLLRVFERDNSEDFLELQALCTYVGGKNADFASHVTLTVDFVNGICAKSSAHDDRIRTATDISFDALFSSREDDEWVTWATELHRRLSQPARCAFVHWCHQRCLPIDEIGDAHDRH